MAGDQSAACLAQVIFGHVGGEVYTEKRIHVSLCSPFMIKVHYAKHDMPRISSKVLHARTRTRVRCLARITHYTLYSSDSSIRATAISAL